VEDVSRRESCDLFCTRDNQRLHVEVKGTVSSGEEVFLTAGEVRFARSHEAGMALFVLHSIQLSGAGSSINATGGTPIIHQPWQIDGSRLSPVAYTYSVPQVTLSHVQA
jgi:hypothetical protein